MWFFLSQNESRHPVVFGTMCHSLLFGLLLHHHPYNFNLSTSSELMFAGASFHSLRLLGDGFKATTFPLMFRMKFTKLLQIDEIRRQEPRFLFKGFVFWCGCSSCINPPNLKQQFRGVLAWTSCQRWGSPVIYFAKFRSTPQQRIEDAGAVNFQSRRGPDLTVLQCEVWCQDVGIMKRMELDVIVIAVKLFYKDREAVCACWVCMCGSERLNDWAGWRVRDLQFRIWKKKWQERTNKTLLQCRYSTPVSHLVFWLHSAMLACGWCDVGKGVTYTNPNLMIGCASRITSGLHRAWHKVVHRYIVNVELKISK